MPKVFISHSWEDNDISRKISTHLKRNGAEIWIDYTRIKGGDTLPTRIGEALEWCDTLVLIWSKAASKSYWVKEEWTNALALQKKIIPCILDSTKLPPILSSRLFINFQNFDTGCRDLCKALRLEITPIETNAKIKSELELKFAARAAIKSAFSSWKIHPNFPEGEYISEILDGNKNKYIVISRYIDPEKALNFPSEKVTKCIAISKKSNFPLIVVSNAQKLTNKAEKVLYGSNLKIVLGSNINDFIQEFKKIGAVRTTESALRPFIIISFIENENKFVLKNIGNSPALEVKIEDVPIVKGKDLYLFYTFHEIDIIPAGEERELKVYLKDASGIREADSTFDIGALIPSSAVKVHNLLIRCRNINNEEFQTKGKWGKGGIVISRS